MKTKKTYIYIKKENEVIRQVIEICDIVNFCRQNGVELTPNQEVQVDEFYRGRKQFVNFGFMGVYPALAATAEEHQKIYKELQQKEQEEKAAREHRLYTPTAEQMQTRTGQYYVEVDVQLMHIRTGRFVVKTWSVDLFANSALDAYSKATDHKNFIINNPDENYVLLNFAPIGAEYTNIQLIKEQE